MNLRERKVRILAQQSAQGAHNIEEFRDRLIARIRALSSAYSLMSVGDGDAPVELGALVGLTLAPFRDSYGERMRITGGPSVDLAPSAAIPIALCLYELATNAVKYGALSSSSGVVTIVWLNQSPGAYTVRWVESDGPRVDAPRANGFGSRLINAALNGIPGGGAILKFAPEGVTCELTFASA